MGLASWINRFVIDRGEDLAHNCVWVLSFINGQPIGFCLIYDPNCAKERCDLWDWLSNNLPWADLVFGGDFNMVEHHSDRSWSNCVKLSNDEFDKWLFCHNTVGVIDPISKKYSSHHQIGLLGLTAELELNENLVD